MTLIQELTKHLENGIVGAKIRRVMKKLKTVNKIKNPGLAKLPKEVRNKMGYMKEGGKAETKKRLEAAIRVGALTASRAKISKMLEKMPAGEKTS